MNRTILNLAAMCDRAGRSVNQDNFFVCQDLSAGSFSAVNNDDRDVTLSEKGALVVVADGMGGMNAGEVASKIVIETIKSYFASIPNDILKDEKKVKGFITQAIISADREVKQFAKERPEASGMGSTVVILWIVRDKAYVGWCGDSRAYCYNPQNRLVRLTHDHSYVQDLVDQKKISEDDAFDHPDSNIITRSLGDSGQRANPDVEVYPIHKDDVFLLCSDGLCGLLRDNEIQSIIEMNSQSMKGCLMALWNQGTRTGWSDNATVELVRIKECGVTATSIPCGWTENHKPVTQRPQQLPRDESAINKLNKNHWLYVICAALVIGALLGFFIGRASAKKSDVDTTKDEQISFLQLEVTKLNNQKDSLQRIINKGHSTQQNNTAVTTRTTTNQNTGRSTTTRQQESSRERTQTQQNTNPGTAQQETSPSDITEVPQHHQEDFSQLDPNYINQIQNTIVDFESFKSKMDVFSQVGNMTNQDYNEMSQRLRDIKSNLSTIRKNDSYQYIPQELKNSIGLIDKALPGLSQTLEQLKPQEMQSVRIRRNGNGNGHGI